jgi:virginiamycin B lyase
MHGNHRIGRLIAALLLTTSLTACGSGGPPDDAPASATPAPAATTKASAETPAASATPGAFTATITSYPVPRGAAPHDVAPAADGGVWYTAQRAGALGHLDPKTGTTRHIPLGPGSAPHGVIVGSDGAAWVTDGGLNAIVRVAPGTDEVKVYALPADRPSTNLNTAAFDGRGRIWFTGQNGIYGRLDPASGVMAVFDAPRGRGPYGITSTPSGDIYYASLAGSHIAKIDLETDRATVIEPPTAAQGARRVWSDSQGMIWVSEWNSGNVSRYDPATGAWKAWKLPGTNPRTYSVYVDEQDAVWLTDFTANTVVRFDPRTEAFTSFPNQATPGNVRQMLGRPGEVWAPESAADLLTVLRYEVPGGR